MSGDFIEVIQEYMDTKIPYKMVEEDGYRYHFNCGMLYHVEKIDDSELLI